MSLTITWRFAGSWRALLAGDEQDWARESRLFRLPMPRIIARMPGAVSSCVTYLARLTSLAFTSLACAAFIGVCANMAGGFYTSWSSVAESFMEGLR